MTNEKELFCFVKMDRIYYSIFVTTFLCQEKCHKHSVTKQRKDRTERMWAIHETTLSHALVPVCVDARNGAICEKGWWNAFQQAGLMIVGGAENYFVTISEKKR